MAQSDEPSLDELKRLLRRLEKAELGLAAATGRLPRSIDSAPLDDPAPSSAAPHGGPASTANRPLEPILLTTQLQGLPQHPGEQDLPNRPSKPPQNPPPAIVLGLAPDLATDVARPPTAPPAKLTGPTASTPASTPATTPITLVSKPLLELGAGRNAAALGDTASSGEPAKAARPAAALHPAVTSTPLSASKLPAALTTAPARRASLDMRRSLPPAAARTVGTAKSVASPPMVLAISVGSVAAAAAGAVLLMTVGNVDFRGLVTGDASPRHGTVQSRASLPAPEVTPITSNMSATGFAKARPPADSSDAAPPQAAPADVRSTVAPPDASLAEPIGTEPGPVIVAETAKTANVPVNGEVQTAAAPVAAVQAEQAKAPDTLTASPPAEVATIAAPVQDRTTPPALVPANEPVAPASPPLTAGSSPVMNSPLDVASSTTSRPSLAPVLAEPPAAKAEPEAAPKPVMSPPSPDATTLPGTARSADAHPAAPLPTPGAEPTAQIVSPVQSIEVAPSATETRAGPSVEKASDADAKPAEPEPPKLVSGPSPRSPIAETNTAVVPADVAPISGSALGEPTPVVASASPPATEIATSPQPGAEPAKKSDQPTERTISAEPTSAALASASPGTALTVPTTWNVPRGQRVPLPFAITGTVAHAEHRLLITGLEAGATISPAIEIIEGTWLVEAGSLDKARLERGPDALAIATVSIELRSAAGTLIAKAATALSSMPR